MNPFQSVTAVAVPLDDANVDTDQIIPARYLALPRHSQVDAMFHDLRHDASARPRADFALNLPAYRDARILVGNHNFGCGSSRESAVTVMVDNGFQVFIAPSFGDIFFSNCFQHGALPIRLPTLRVDAIRALLHAKPGAGMTIDLHAQQVLGPDGLIDQFEIDAFRKECLLLGTDAVGLTFGYATQIADYEQRHPRVWS